MEKLNQKCWYCKRNDADPKFLNTEENQSTEVKLKGFYKYKKTTTKTWKVVRCKDCYEIHQKGNREIGIASVIAYLISYILLCVLFDASKNWFEFFIFLFLALVPTYIIAYITAFSLGHFYASKYNTQPKWSRGGDVL